MKWWFGGCKSDVYHTNPSPTTAADTPDEPSPGDGWECPSLCSCRSFLLLTTVTLPDCCRRNPSQLAQQQSGFHSLYLMGTLCDTRGNQVQSWWLVANAEFRHRFLQTGTQFWLLRRVYAEMRACCMQWRRKENIYRLKIAVHAIWRCLPRGRRGVSREMSPVKNRQTRQQRRNRQTRPTQSNNQSLSMMAL